ncbi:terminase [bacterium]|nr:terminase [bacterium]
MSEESSYHGNINLKPIGYKHTFTQEQLEELIKCQEDPIYFIENYCQIVTLDHGLQLFKLYECQKRKVHHILNNRKAILMEGRQQGKTITSAACILWYTLFQEAKSVAILANKTAAAREVMNRYQGMYENLPLWMQQGVKTWNKGDVELENGSKVFTAATTASGIRGKSVNWLYIDEAAIIPNTVAEQFFASVYPTISAGTTTKILLTSTPLGYNHFWKFWNEAEKGVNGFEPMFIPYTEIPGRDEAWAEEQLKMLGELKFNQEVLCNFLGSSNTLVAASTLGAMSSIDPIYMKDGLDIFEDPLPDRTYVMGVDTARGIGGDYSAFTVVDATEVPYKLVAKYRNNKIPPMLYPNIVNKVARDYNNAHVMIEINDIGQQVADILHSELEYDNILTTAKDTNKQYLSPGFGKATQMGVRMTKQVKRQGCFTLKSLMEEKKLLVFDADTISEFSTFIEKQGSWMADEGYFDDLVMSLVLFAWVTSNTYFRDLTDIDIRKKLYDSQMKQIEEELTPFGILSSGLEDETFIDNSGDLWTVDRDSDKRGWLL